MGLASKSASASGAEWKCPYCVATSNGRTLGFLIGDFKTPENRKKGTPHAPRHAQHSRPVEVAYAHTYMQQTRKQARPNITPHEACRGGHAFGVSLRTKRQRVQPNPRAPSYLLHVKFFKGLEHG